MKHALTRRPSTRYLDALSHLVGCLIVVVALAPPSALAMDDDVSYALRQELEVPLKARVKNLLRERDENDNEYKRGTYSKHFTRVDDNTYQVVFQLDTALAGNMTTERRLLTLERDPATGTWTIADESIEDTYSGLHRRVPGDETFQRFDSFSLDLGGLTIKATNGTVLTDSCQGKVEVLWVSAEKLKYDYRPPTDQIGVLYEAMKQEKKSDFIFTPDHITLFCDPHSCAEILESRFTGLTSSSREEADQTLRKEYDDYIHDQRASRRDDGFSGFHRPYDDDRRLISVAVKKQSANHRLRLRSDNAAPRELTFSVSGYGPLYSYYSPATQNSGISRYELEQRPDLGGRYFDLKGLKGTVELGLDQSQRLRADMTFSMVTLMPLRELPFSIARLSRGRSSSREAKNPRMTVDTLQDASGNELTWVKTGPVSGVVILPELVPAGTNLTLRMRFTNDDSLIRYTPSYAYVSRGGWLPFVRFEDMIDDFDLTVRVPAKFKVLSVGTLVEEATEKGVSTTRWVAKSPVTFPTVIYGDYVEATPGFDATTLAGDKIPITIHVDRDGMRAWSIRPKQLRPLADDAANALNLYREVYGQDYPFGRLDLVNDPLGGLYGQSPASLIYLGSAAFRGEGAIGEGTGSVGTLFIKSLVAHEVAHQWWGGLINNANERNYWFIESLAEYSAALFVEARYGADAYRKHVQAWRREILNADLRVSVQDAPVLWNGGGAGYRAAVYAQGPYMFHIMRNTFGDEKFFAFLKALAHDLKGKAIVTRDIQNVAEKVFKVKMEEFFDQWIRGVGMPEYKLEYTTRRAEAGGYVVEGRIVQQVVLGKKKRVIPDRYFMAAVRLTMAGKKGKSYAKTLLVQGPETEFRVNVPEQPRSVHLNEGGEVLARDIIVVAGSS